MRPTFSAARHLLPATSAAPHAIEERVVLLADSGEPIGTSLKSEVHGPRTPLHLAFSLYLFDADDRLLLTRRALTKRTWPGVWTNTCCGHPQPGEAPEAAVRRRVQQELGLELGDLECVLPDFAYHAVDVSGVVENEVCPVFRARVVHPSVGKGVNAAEVMDWKWGPWQDIVTAAEAAPYLFSPWAVLQVSELAALG